MQGNILQKVVSDHFDDEEEQKENQNHSSSSLANKSSTVHRHPSNYHKSNDIFGQKFDGVQHASSLVDDGGPVNNNEFGNKIDPANKDKLIKNKKGELAPNLGVYRRGPNKDSSDND